MEDHRSEYCIETMSRVLRVSPSGYYHWRSHQSSSYRQRNIHVLAEIRRIVKDSRETYGSPRVQRELGRRGFPCNRKRVAKLMRDNHIQAKTRKRYRVTTNSSTTRTASPNIVKQQFHAERPNQLWTSDMTFVWTREGWLYLAVILDVFARRIVGYAMSHRIDAALVTQALRSALTHRLIVPGLVFHSDRGSQYSSDSVRAIVEAHKMIQSMSGSGNCYDNAITESFFHTLKTELVHWHTFNTREEARQVIFEYIEVFYNRQRLHSSLKYMAPVNFEQRYHISH